MMPAAPELLTRLTGTFRYSASQAASSSVDGESASPVTVAPVIFSYGGRSSAETSWARQCVRRVQARSVSPSVYAFARVVSALTGFFSAAESVIRRWASSPSGSLSGSFGPAPGHQVTIGASGSSSGTTALWPWPASGP